VVRPVAPRSAQPPNVSLSGIDDLVQGLAAAEADAAIETDSAVVLGGDLEKSAVHAGTLEAVQGLKQKGTAQAAAAMARHDSQVLNRAGAGSFAQALDRAAKTRIRGDEPCRRRLKAALAADLTHQVRATLAIAQARKHRRVELIQKALILDLGVHLQECVLPGHEMITDRKLGRGQPLLQVDFHAETLEVTALGILMGDDHGVPHCGTAY